VYIASMFLFVCVLRSARGRLPIFSSDVITVGFVTPGMASLGLSCVSFVPMGSGEMCSFSWFSSV
jgi:hypothetical protein